MVRIAALLMALWPIVATAQETAAPSPVVVELFTSQGCSACPPADAFLSRLAERDDIIALSLHVDYWDYIGWADPFALPEHTLRQKRYAAMARKTMIYTPQMVVAGQIEARGHDAPRVLEAVKMAQTLPTPVALELRREGAEVIVSLTPLGSPQGAAEIVLVRYIPEGDTEVTRGENAGRHMHHRHIVTGWSSLGQWDGRTPWRGRVSIPGDTPGAVLIQAEGPGPIFAAARLPQ